MPVLVLADWVDAPNGGVKTFTTAPPYQPGESCWKKSPVKSTDPCQSLFVKVTPLPVPGPKKAPVDSVVGCGNPDAHGHKVVIC